MAKILLIEEDDDARPILRDILRREGYEVLVAVDEETAVAWLDAGHPSADLILVNLVGKLPDEALAVARRVRGHNALDGSTPVVVIAEHYEEELEGSDVRAGEREWVTYMEDATQLNALLSRLTGRDGAARPPEGPRS